MKLPSPLWLVAGLAVATIAATGAASAARLTLASGGVGAGTAVVAHCDDAVSATVGWAGTTKTKVTVTGIAPACAGGTLSVTLTSNGTPVATAAPVLVPVGGGQLVIPVTSVATAAATDARVVVVGP